MSSVSSSSSFDLSGKTALVTGASQGIGYAAAERLAAHGARVVVAARSEDKLKSLEGKITEDGGVALAFPLDLASPERVGDRLKELPEEFSGIDILVNNAGITADNLLMRMKIEEWDRVLRTNLTGTYAVTKALARGMMKKRWGRIISVSSVVALMGNAGQANYAAAKAGLIGFSKSLARELASRGITVNVVAPGYVTTAMTDELGEASKTELQSAIPLKRLGTVEDIASAVLYLASEEAGYITGHVLNVSGGLYI
ncbi:MAG: 3-oxoacyl-[acyl-carrier-protein] reductase [Acidobacteriota bacterium]|nr:3-oxoacyl-[acyl-carrier-protein] reductase [Acidobacteriota bacterium]